jgi:hypothetical protein
VHEFHDPVAHYMELNWGHYSCLFGFIKVYFYSCKYGWLFHLFFHSSVYICAHEWKYIPVCESVT